MTAEQSQRVIADPAINVGDQPFFDAAAQEKLLVKKCADCNQVHHYPRATCPFCLSGNVSWLEAAGTGKIYSYSVTRRIGPVVYCIAYVTLTEGVTMMTNIVDCDLEKVRIGLPVKAVFKKSTGGISVPMFTLA